MQSAPSCGRAPRLLLAATVLGAVAAATGSAQGNENMTTTILVTASVAEQCSLQTAQIPLNFGIYDDETIQRQPSFTYNCPQGKNITFRLRGGEPINGNNFRELPNVDVPGSAPLEYIINNPNGSTWIDDFPILNTPGGEQLVEFAGNWLSMRRRSGFAAVRG